MAGLIKRRNVWHINIMLNGQRVRQSTGTNDKKLAENILAKIRTQIVEGKYYPKPPGDSILFCEMMERFVKEHSPFVSTNTLKSYEFSLKHLLPVFAEMSLIKIMPERICQYQQDRILEGSAPASINREIALLSKAFSTAVKKWKWVNANPCKAVDSLPENNERIRYLANSEVEKLYKELPAWLVPIVTVARFTGLRLSNILSLSWESVDIFRKVILVGKTKNGEPIGLPMNRTVFDTLKKLNKVRHLSTKIIFPNNNGRKRCRHKVSREFKQACKKAGVENFRFHDLRHDFGSNLVQRGVDIYSVAKLMGHKDIRMTQRYSHLSPEKLMADISVLDTPLTQIYHKGSTKGALRRSK